MTTKRIRFMNNNFMDRTFTYSSQKSTAFAAANVYNTSRARIWRPAGNFEVTASNKEIYINDGSDKTVSLTVGTYTYSTLAAHIQTQLNASSSNWTCTYSTTTFKFTINRSSGTAVLRQAVTTNAAWDMLGYTLGTNAAVAPFVADEQRNHTDEWFKTDVSLAQLPTFFAILGEVGETFCLTDGATVKIQANNVDSWTSPPINVTVPVESLGVFKVLDSDITSAYRYFRVQIIDRLNPLGPEGLGFSYVYVGDHTTVTATNLAGGFTKSIIDPSISETSESGAQYFDIRPKFWRISNSEIQMLNGTEFDELEQLFYTLGTTTPFLVCIDPDQAVSRELGDLTYYAIMSQNPELRHVIRDYYNVSFEMREAF